MDKIIHAFYGGMFINDDCSVSHRYIPTNTSPNTCNIIHIGSRFNTEMCIGTVCELEIDSENNNIRLIKLIGKTDADIDLSAFTLAHEMAKKHKALNKKMTKLPKTRYDAIIEELKKMEGDLPNNQKKLFAIKVYNDLIS